MYYSDKFVFKFLVLHLKQFILPREDEASLDSSYCTTNYRFITLRYNCFGGGFCRPQFSQLSVFYIFTNYFPFYNFPCSLKIVARKYMGQAYCRRIPLLFMNLRGPPEGVRKSSTCSIQCIIKRSNALRLIGLFGVFGHYSELSDITFRDVERYYLLEWLWWPFLFVEFLDESRRNFSGFCNVTVQKFSLARSDDNDHKLFSIKSI